MNILTTKNCFHRTKKEHYRSILAEDKLLKSIRSLQQSTQFITKCSQESPKTLKERKIDRKQVKLGKQITPALNGHGPSLVNNGTVELIPD